MLSSRWRVNLKIFYSNGSFVKISGSFRELLSGRAAKLSARAKFFRPGHVLSLLWNVDTIKVIFQRKKNCFWYKWFFCKIFGSFRELLSGRTAKLSARAKFFRPGHVLSLRWNVDTNYTPTCQRSVIIIFVFFNDHLYNDLKRFFLCKPKNNPCSSFEKV